MTIMMKRMSAIIPCVSIILLFALVLCFACVTKADAAEPLTLKDVLAKKFQAETVSGINPIEGTADYSRISDDGKKVERYSFKTGKKVAVLFDLEGLLNSFDDYIISPDGKQLLIQTETKPHSQQNTTCGTCRRRRSESCRRVDRSRCLRSRPTAKRWLSYAKTTFLLPSYSRKQSVR